MATIINPTPVIPSTFGAMWVQHINIFLPTEERPTGFLNARLLPYDGTTLLALGGKDVRKPINGGSDGQTQAMLAGITEEVKRQKNTAANPMHISVMAQDPSKPVRAMIRFDDRTHHNIPNCFELAGTDAQFAGVLVGVLAEIGRLAGLEVAE